MDAVDLIVSALVRAGKTREEAEHEADWILSEMDKLGFRDVYISVLMRRRKVYHLRSIGMSSVDVAKRMGICLALAKRDYVAELMRRRSAA